MSFDRFTFILTEFGPQLLHGLIVTLYLAIIGTIIGALLALGVAVLRVQKVSKNDTTLIKVLKHIGLVFAKTYITVFRGTPLIVQALLFFYLGLAVGLNWSPISAGLFAVAVNTTAYLAEIFRSAIQNLDKGQSEAAKALGMNTFQMYVFIIFPQALKNSLAAIGNEIIVNIKDTAVLNVIGVADLFMTSRIISGGTFWHIEPLLVVAAIYLILTVVSSRLLIILEKKMGTNNTDIIKSSATVEVK